MAKWFDYNGSDEQIAKLLTSSDKFIVDSKWSVFKDPSKLMLLPIESNIIWLKELLDSCGVKRFMFCEPHPYADIIKIWADTGCEVWVKIYIDGSYAGLPIADIPIYSTTRPDWNIPGAEYRLTPFEDQINAMDINKPEPPR